MKDLDFDELDRAVNSLMTNVPKSSPAQGDDKEKTLTISSTLDDDTPPAFDRVEKAAAKVSSGSMPSSDTKPQEDTPVSPRSSISTPLASARPQPSAAPAARRSGRFMDVVHPSAAMKKPEAPKMVSRQGVTIEPTRAGAPLADITPPDTKPQPTPAEPPKPEVEKKTDVTPVEPVPATVEPEQTSPKSDWPDPLDMMQSAEEKNMADKKEEDKEIEAPKEPEETSAPIASPFLPDTKVEKRPLGGTTPLNEPTEEPAHPPVSSTEEEPKTVDNPNDQLPANPTDVETPLPEELQSDLMAVEADTTHDELKQAHDSEAEKEETTAGKTTGQSTEKPSTSENESTPVGPTSIPQQYHEEPSTGDQNSGAIYDTDSYHQPLAHPAKKKSGWLIIVWIVLVLVLGAAGGAALYFFGLV